MKTICVAFFTLCLFTIANGQYAANLALNELNGVEAAARNSDPHKKIARRNALIKAHNEQAQQTLMQYLTETVTYPEKLRTLMAEGRVIVAIQLNLRGEVQHYNITQSPDPAFSKEVERLMDNAPAVVGSSQAYLGARKLIVPIDFSLQ